MSTSAAQFSTHCFAVYSVSINDLVLLPYTYHAKLQVCTYCSPLLAGAVAFLDFGALSAPVACLFNPDDVA